MGMDHAESKIEFGDDVLDVIPEPLSFEEAEKLFLMRIPMTKEEWEELEAKLRFRAFTVARLTELDAINAIREKLIKVLQEGKTLRQFWDEGGKDELLKRAGFHRSNPWYWETVFRTNIQTAYNAGRAYQFRKAKPAYLEFVGITDARQTKICRARSGVIRPADDPWWSSNWPPLHFNCRSTVRAVHREEFETLGLSITRNLPSEPPAKGFGVHPLESGSYWKLTPQMIERAKKYGIYDEIVKAARELGLDVKEIQIRKGLAREAKKSIALVDKFNYITFEEVGEFTKEFVRSNKELFPHRELKEMKAQYIDSGFMIAYPLDGLIVVSSHEFKSSRGYNPARDLRSALQKLKANQPLTFNEEHALESLWHELNHLRPKGPTMFDKKEVIIMETINEFYSRHTFDKLFVKRIKPDAKLQFKKRILEEGYGYQVCVQNFRYLLKRIGVKEKEAVKELEEIFLDNHIVLYIRVVAWIADKAKLTDAQVKKILDNIEREPEKFKTKLEAILAEAKRNRV
jgi:SPP1 gp7 family putative phage head morphogenesis protein